MVHYIQEQKSVKLKALDGRQPSHLGADDSFSDLDPVCFFNLRLLFGCLVRFSASPLSSLLSVMMLEGALAR